MQVRIIATDGGKHSDAKLAVAVADHIVQIGATASGQIVEEGRKLQAQIADIMEDHFHELAKSEMGGIQEFGTRYLATNLEPHKQIIEEATHDICLTIEDSPFAAWFSRETTESMVRGIVGQYLVIAQHMHCDWFARHGKIGHGRELSDAQNHNPDCPHVQRWIAMHTQGDPQAIHEHAILSAGGAI